MSDESPHGSCPHCGYPRPYSFVGGFHCHDDYWNKLYADRYGTGRINWYQGDVGGRWPTDWPVA